MPDQILALIPSNLCLEEWIPRCEAIVFPVGVKAIANATRLVGVVSNDLDDFLAANSLSERAATAWIHEGNFLLLPCIACPTLALDPPVLNLRLVLLGTLFSSVRHTWKSAGSHRLFVERLHTRDTRSVDALGGPSDHGDPWQSDRFKPRGHHLITVTHGLAPLASGIGHHDSARTNAEVM